MTEQCFFCGGTAQISHEGRPICYGCLGTMQKLEAMFKGRIAIGMTDFYQAFLHLPERFRAGTRESICRYVWDRLKATNPELRG